MTPGELIERLRAGGAFGPTEVRFEQSQVDAYAEATGAPDAYTEVPEPLLVAACIQAFDSAFGRVPGTLHLGQDLTVTSRPAPGVPVTVEGRVVAGEEARRGWRFTIEFRGRTPGPTPCFTGKLSCQVLR